MYMYIYIYICIHTYTCGVACSFTSCIYSSRGPLTFGDKLDFHPSGKVGVCLHKSNCCSEIIVGEITANSYHKIQVFSDPTLRNS